MGIKSFLDEFKAEVDERVQKAFSRIPKDTDDFGMMNLVTDYCNVCKYVEDYQKVKKAFGVFQINRVEKESLTGNLVAPIKMKSIDMDVQSLLNDDTFPDADVKKLAKAVIENNHHYFQGIVAQYTNKRLAEDVTRQVFGKAKKHD